MTDISATLNSDRGHQVKNGQRKNSNHTQIITKSKANLSHFDAIEAIERQRQLNDGYPVLPRVFSGKGVKVSKQGSNNSGGSGQININKNVKRSDGSNKQIRIKQHMTGARSTNQRIGRSCVIKSTKSANLTAPKTHEEQKLIQKHVQQPSSGVHFGQSLALQV